MSGLILMRTEVYVDKLSEFFEALSSWTLKIEKVYHFGAVEFKTIDVHFGLEHLGYAEPQHLYHDIKDYVVDLWEQVTGDVDLKEGKDCKAYLWESCKKKLKDK